MERTSTSINLTDLFGYFFNNKILIIFVALFSVIIGYIYTEFFFKTSSKISYINYKDSSLFNEEFDYLINLNDIAVTEETKDLVLSFPNVSKDIFVRFNQNFEELITEESLNNSNVLSHNYKYQIIDNYKNIISFYTKNTLESKKDFNEKIDLVKKNIISKYINEKRLSINKINYLIELSISEKQILYNQLLNIEKKYSAYFKSRSHKDLPTDVSTLVAPFEFKLQSLLKQNEDHFENYLMSIEESISSKKTASSSVRNLNGEELSLAYHQLYNEFHPNPGLLSVIDQNILKYELNLLNETKLIPKIKNQIFEIEQLVRDIIFNEYKKQSKKNSVLINEIEKYKEKLSKNENLIKKLDVVEYDLLGIFSGSNNNKILVELVSINKIFYLMLSLFLGLVFIFFVLFIFYINKKSTQNF